MTDLLLLAYSGFLVLISGGLLLIEVVKRMEKKNGDSDDTVPQAGRVLVIVPCRGHDISLTENLMSIRKQEFANYDAVAVVDSEDDVAIHSIREAGMDYIVSSADCTRCSGKVRAISTALEKFSGYDTYVIADSDATFSSRWLRKLVAPLADPKVGLSTAFPVFIPCGGFWSRVKMVWGFVGNSMMESSITRFGWGGSLAFRSKLLDNGKLGVFSESVSDDAALTHIAADAGLSIAYCDGNIVTVKSRETLSSFVEWSNRQTALAIRGNRNLFAMGLVYYTARLLLLVSSIVLSVTATPLALLLLAPFAVGIVKIYGRHGVRDPAVAPIFLAMDVFYIANLVKAKRMDTISWRGRQYALNTE